MEPFNLNPQEKAEAYMRKSDELYIKVLAAKAKISRWRLREISRRAQIKQEWNRLEGPRAHVLRTLENAADLAHDERLSERDRLKTLIRSWRGAKLNATIQYEEAEGRVHDES